MSCFEATTRPSRKHLNDGAVLADCRLPEVPVIFVECECVSIYEAKSQVCQSLAVRYPDDFEEFPAAAHEERTIIDVLARPGECSLLELGQFEGRSHSGNRDCICGDYEHFCEWCSEVSESVPSLFPELLSLAICIVEALSRASILKVSVEALESTLASNNTRMRELESPFASKNPKLNVATAELESTKRRLWFSEDAFSLRQENFQSQ